MVRVPTDREPTHPGEMLLEEFLKPNGITQRELADRIHVPYQPVNELVNKRRGMTPQHSTALVSGFWKPALFLDESPASMGPFSGSADRGSRTPEHSACTCH